MNITLSIGLLAIALVLLLIALLGEIQIAPGWRIGTNNKPIRWTAVFIGFGVLYLAILYRPVGASPPNRQTNSTSSMADQEPTATKEDPRKLIEIIKSQQEDKVGDSWGVYAYQCFTQDKLDDFVKSGKTRQVTEQLKKDDEFIEVVLAIKAMSPSDRQKLFDLAQNTYRKTWGELGLDPAKSPESELRKGQTDAGQRAEKLVSEAIVNLAKDLSRRSAKEIRKASLT